METTYRKQTHFLNLASQPLFPLKISLLPKSAVGTIPYIATSSVSTTVISHLVKHKMNDSYCAVVVITLEAGLHLV